MTKTRRSFTDEFKREAVALLEGSGRTPFETREQARREVFPDIETDCNRQRAHSAIGYRTPEQAELQSA